jgi:hypothetical protein
MPPKVSLSPQTPFRTLLSTSVCPDATDSVTAAGGDVPAAGMNCSTTLAVSVPRFRIFKSVL